MRGREREREERVRGEKGGEEMREGERREGREVKSMCI